MLNKLCLVGILTSSDDIERIFSLDNLRKLVAI